MNGVSWKTDINFKHWFFIKAYYMKNLLTAAVLILVYSSCAHTYYVVRHAEKAQVSAGTQMSTPNDPPLTEAGLQRAEKLKELLKNKKIGYIFSTNTTRTLSTARPLADYTGISPQLYDLKKDTGFITKLKSLKKNTLIVGHSNTIDDIVNALCNDKKVPADIDDKVYDNLFVVKYTGKKIYFKNLHY
jgi:phosphohistidine phosphatase SixA